MKSFGKVVEILTAQGVRTLLHTQQKTNVFLNLCNSMHSCGHDGQIKKKLKSLD
jgi:hypothetical protein